MDVTRFGPIDARLMPYIAEMEYDAAEPKWCE